jgi:hypothetical protein
VGAYLMVVALVTAGLAARSAKGSVSEQAMATGRQLAKLGEFTKAPERLLLNGQAMNMASAMTDLSLGQVLDRFEAICKEDGVVPRDLREVKSLLDDPTLAKEAQRLNYGVLRTQDKEEGFVACTVANPANGNRRFWDAVGAFSESWDVAELGHLRYAYVRRAKSGRTHVLTAWTDGPFKLAAMVAPADGVDAPGTDSQNVPRPPSSIRYLSASAEGLPHGIRIYESTATAKEILTGYEQQLETKGFTRAPLGEDAPTARYFTKNGVDVLLAAEQNGDHAYVTLMESRGF